MRSAALGLSRAMYAASTSRSARARLSHLTSTAFPLLAHCRYFLFGGEVSCVRFSNAFLDLFDLPLIERHEFPDGFRRQERTAALRGLCQLVKFLLELIVYSESENCWGCHTKYYNRIRSDVFFPWATYALASFFMCSTTALIATSSFCLLARTSTSTLPSANFLLPTVIR